MDNKFNLSEKIIETKQKFVHWRSYLNKIPLYFLNYLNINFRLIYLRQIIIKHIIC